MAQYGTYTDGTFNYRDGVRNGEYVIDVALTPLGFDPGGVENTDWKNLFNLNNKKEFKASSSLKISSSTKINTRYI